MARIAGVDLPTDKRIEAALTYIYGIGFTTSRKILKEAVRALLLRKLIPGAPTKILRILQFWWMSHCSAEITFLLVNVKD